jgi:hypothetical protein
MNPEPDQPFLVGAELVEFDHRDLPIYQTAPADLAGGEPLSWGAPLDRLFGDRDDLHIDGTLHTTTAATAGFAPDPLVELATLADSLPLPSGDPALAAIVDGPDAHAVAHLHDGWHDGQHGGQHGGLTFDYAGIDWTFDGQS